MLKIRKKDTATMSNVLNEMVCKGLTFQQLRFFLVYLSRLNPKDPNCSTEITFSFKEYQKILGVELNEQNIDKVTEDLMKMIVNIRPAELREYEAEAVIKCPLFTECRLYKDKRDEEYYFTFECHKRTKQELFDMASRFTSIQVWNTLNLHSLQNARIYMLLKQYKKLGFRVIRLDELKPMLGIDEEAYPEYKEFSRTVLKKAQKALKEKTDICFDYKAIGRPAHSVKFTIMDNTDYELPEFLKEQAAKEQKAKQIMDGKQASFSDPDSFDSYVKSYKNEDKEPVISKKGITDDRENKLIANFRGAMEDVNPEWTMEDEQILHICNMVNDHLITIPLFRSLNVYEKDIYTLDFYYAILRKALAEKAMFIYRYLVTQWDRFLNEVKIWQ